MHKLHVLNAEAQPICRNFRARESVLFILSPLRNCSRYAIAPRMVAITVFSLLPVARFTFDYVYVIVYASARTYRQWMDVCKHKQVQNTTVCYGETGANER